MERITLPHNQTTFLVKHRSGGKYLYTGRTTTIQKVLDQQNKESLISIEKLDVDMVIIE